MKGRFPQCSVRKQKVFLCVWARSWPTPMASFVLLSASTFMLFVLERERYRRREKRKLTCSYVNSAKQQHNTGTSQKYQWGFQACVQRVIWHFSGLKFRLYWNFFPLYLSPDVQSYLVSNFIFSTWLCWFQWVLTILISSFNSSYTLFISEHSRKEITSVIPGLQWNIEAYVIEMSENFLLKKNPKPLV